MTQTRECDALVIGAGYYGCNIALHLKSRGFGRIVVAERDADIMRRASYNNQARVHNGYHYPRSIQTAKSSHENFHRWIGENDYAVDRSMRMIYGLAQGSLVSPSQFERFCREIAAPIRPLTPHEWQIFNRDRMLAAYEVEEFAFDAQLIAEDLRRRLADAGIDLRVSTSARVEEVDDDRLVASLNGERIKPTWIFNCAYDAIDSVGIPLRTGLRREWAELALFKPPAELQGVGVTIMDGPFFSSMPFPALGLHTMSHVRFTPIAAWLGADEQPEVPFSTGVNPSINANAMVRDAARFMPIFGKIEPLQSIYAVKTVLATREADDGRPILFEFADRSPNVISILGGKYDNIYDAFDALDDLIRE